MEWLKVESNDRSAVEESFSEGIDVTYEILPHKQNYIVYRISNDYKYEDGILGYFESDVGICCGISLYSAIGLPPASKCDGDIEHVKSLAESDLINLENGIGNIFVGKLMGWRKE